MRVKHIVLPEYDYTIRNGCCYECGRPLNHIITSHTYTHTEPHVTVSNIHAYQCPICLQVIYNSVTAQTIEEALFNAVYD